jgi:hypothetical protein
MGLGLRPEYNDSYKNQLKLYADNNNGADFRTSEDAVGYRTRPPAQTSTPNANTSGGSSGPSDQNIKDILNVANASYSKINYIDTKVTDIDNKVADVNQRTANLVNSANNADYKLNNINNRLTDFDASVSDKLTDINSKVIIADGKVANIGGYMQDIFNRVNNTNNRVNSIYDRTPPPSQTEGRIFPPELTTLLQRLNQANPQLALELRQLLSPASTAVEYFIEDYKTFIRANPNTTVSQSETFARDWLTANTNLNMQLTQAQMGVLGELFSTNPVLQQQFQQRVLTDRRLTIDTVNFIRTNPNFTANQLATFLTNWFAANPSATSQGSINNPLPDQSGNIFNPPPNNPLPDQSGNIFNPPPNDPPPNDPPPTGPTPSQVAATEEVRQTNPELFTQLNSLSSRVPNSEQLWATALQTYSIENPNFTASQFQTFLTNWLAANTPAPPPNPQQQTESFTNRRKKVYQDFSSRFSLMPTEYAPAL